MIVRGRGSPAGEAGAALLIVLVAAAFVAALALASVVVLETERRIEGTFEWSVQARETMSAGVERVMGELAGISDWSQALNGSIVGLQGDGPGPLMGGTSIDLEAVRVQVQAESDAKFSGSNRPVWRLFESGRLTTLIGGSSSAAQDYVAVWIADDGWDTDGDAGTDSNGVIRIHGEAWGAAGARATTDVTVAHGPPTSGCGLAARWNYNPDMSRLSGPIRRWTAQRAGSGPRGYGIVLAGWQGSSPDDPCHVRGPGLMIVTWREVG